MTGRTERAFCGRRPSSWGSPSSVAARRMEGFYTPHIMVNDADVPVGNSTELYAAIVTVF
jgi:hypothetical protein